MNHWGFEALIIALIVFTMIGDDFKIAFLSISVDGVFNIITILAMVIFTFEIIVNSIIQSDYFNSFFFWLDIITSLTLIFDISWVMESMIFSGHDYIANTPEEAQQAIISDEGEALGTKHGQYYRIIRLIRLMRVGRLWRYANKRLNIGGDPDKEPDEF